MIEEQILETARVLKREATRVDLFLADKVAITEKEYHELLKTKFAYERKEWWCFGVSVGAVLTISSLFLTGIKIGVWESHAYNEWMNTCMQPHLEALSHLEYTKHDLAAEYCDRQLKAIKEAKETN